MEKTIISIIVPVYNNEKELEKCIDSLRRQTFQPIEIILVNDGSTDKSVEMCEEFQKQDPRIRVVHLEKRGVSYARNVGVKLAKGAFIGFVDADDYVTPDMYETLYKSLRDTESDIAICKLGRELDGKIMNISGANNYRIELTHLEAMAELFKGELYRFSLCNKLFRKTCFSGVHFPEDRIHEDLATAYQLFHRANKAVYINFIGYIYVKRENSILTTPYHQARLDAFIAWDEIQLFMRKNYPELMDIVNACYTYFLIDHAYFIVNEVKNKRLQKQYLVTLKSTLSKWYKDTKNSSLLTLHYKLLLALIYYNTGMFVCLHRMNNVKKMLLKRMEK